MCLAMRRQCNGNARQCNRGRDNLRLSTGRVHSQYQKSALKIACLYMIILSVISLFHVIMLTSLSLFQLPIQVLFHTAYVVQTA